MATRRGGIEPRTFFLNEQHEPARGEKEGGGRIESNDVPKHRFGQLAVDDCRLSLAKTALANRLLAELSDQPTLEKLEYIRSIEGNALVIDAPRTVAVDDIGVVAASLVDDLVRIPETPREWATSPDVDSVGSA